MFKTWIIVCVTPMKTFEIIPQVHTLCVGNRGSSLAQDDPSQWPSKDENTSLLIPQPEFSNMTRSPFYEDLLHARHCMEASMYFPLKFKTSFVVNVQCRDDETDILSCWEICLRSHKHMYLMEGGLETLPSVLLHSISLKVRRLCSHNTFHLYFLASLCYVANIGYIG